MRKNLLLIVVALAFTFTQTFVVKADEAGIYVKAGTAGTGKSWDDAIGSLSDALTKAKTDGLKFVYVANGEYSEPASVTVPAGISVIGGYTGAGNSTILKNTGEGDVVILDEGTSGSRARISDFTLTGATSGRGINAKAYGEIYNCIIENNNLVATNLKAGAAQDLKESGAGVFLMGNNLLERCIIRNNVAENTVGGGISVFGSNVVIKNCLVTDNVSKGKYKTVKNSTGGILFQANTKNCKVINTTVAGNTGYHTGGIWIAGSNSTQTWTNCVVWGNNSTWDEEGWTAQPNINFKAQTSSTLTCINDYFPQKLQDIDKKEISGISLLSLENNVDDGDKKAPKFTDPERGVFALAAESPLVDAGSDSDYGEGLDHDLTITGESRKSGKSIDIGAYEYQHSSGIVSVHGDNSDCEEIYYTITGIRLGGKPTQPGIYVKVKGIECSKIIVR